MPIQLNVNPVFRIRQLFKAAKQAEEATEKLSRPVTFRARINTTIHNAKPDLKRLDREIARIIKDEQ